LQDLPSGSGSSSLLARRQFPLRLDQQSQQNLAVIEEIVKLIPNKPIRFLVNTHQHFDHIGGLRTYMHIGATIITHQKNWELYTHDVLNYSSRTLDPDMLALAPPPIDVVKVPVPTPLENAPAFVLGLKTLSRISEETPHRKSPD
jgi:glyoxylase-like metal-dependent hydrolase (beta-lactamase superfamily II)